MAANEVQWNPFETIPQHLVSGYDAVIHLSGESVDGRWTEARKNRIRATRVVSTTHLSEALADTEKPPRLFICASAIGYYGNRGDEILTEESSSGAGFLPEVCREWEAATEQASRAGIRTVHLRTGIVLSRDGGALKPMLLPFRLGLGGKIGSGRQWWSWIHIDDFVGAVHHILQSVPADPDMMVERNAIVEHTVIVERRASPPGPLLRGPVNMTAPNPVTNADFTRALAHVLKRPAILPVPALAAKLAFGEFADEGILASTRVQPKRLQESGFEFRHPELSSALKTLL
jgi:NAD dependent epimerase/dehydratase family enzyme